MGTRFNTSLFCLSLLIALMIASCSNPSSQKPVAPASREPAIFLLPQFLWQKDAHRVEVAFPLNNQNPGPVLDVKNAQHEYGFGSSLKAADLYSAAVANGQQFMDSETTHMKLSGWQPLFTPMPTGSFPVYDLYMTFRFGQYYCYIEYTASHLNTTQGIQTLNMYYS